VRERLVAGGDKGVGDEHTILERAGKLSGNNVFIKTDILKSIMKFNCLIEKDEDGYYYASVPSLPGCFTQATSYDELIKRLDEAITLYLETNEPPEPDEQREFVGVQAVEIESC